jgi:tetratricopeptide (TPR) repeat protein
MAQKSRWPRRAILFVVIVAIAAIGVGGLRWRSRIVADAAGARGLEHHANLRYDDALREYRRACELNPAEWRWSYYNALVHLERGEAAEAAEALRRVVEVRPDFGLAWWRLAEAEFKQAHSDAADAAYARAESDPAVSAHAKRGRARVAAARDATSLSNTAPAPAYLPPRDPMIDALADLSHSSVFLLRHAASIDLRRDPDRRERAVRRALEVDPGNPDVVYEVGSVLQQLGRPADALPFFQRHLDMVDDDQQTLVQIGKCYTDLNRLDEAEAALRSALAAGDDAVGYYNLGIVLEQRGRVDDAEQSYRRAVELGPGLARARNNLAGLLAQRGRLEDAAALLTEAIRLDPSMPDAFTNLSAVLLQQGRYADAARQARLAIEMDPRLADAHGNLGVALAQLGDTQQAIQQFDEALRLNPQHASARANRDALARRKP